MAAAKKIAIATAMIHNGFTLVSAFAFLSSSAFNENRRPADSLGMGVVPKPGAAE